jgi:hypothetical protein
VVRETFDRLAQDRDMKTVLLSAITAERERQGSPRRPGGRDGGRGGRGKVEYSSPEHAGEPHHRCREVLCTRAQGPGQPASAGQGHAHDRRQRPDDAEALWAVGADPLLRPLGPVALSSRAARARPNGERWNIPKAWPLPSAAATSSGWAPARPGRLRGRAATEGSYGRACDHRCRASRTRPDDHHNVELPMTD